MVYEHAVAPPRERRSRRHPRLHAALHRRARDVRAALSGSLAVDAPPLAGRRRRGEGEGDVPGARARMRVRARSREFAVRMRSARRVRPIELVSKPAPRASCARPNWLWGCGDGAARRMAALRAALRETRDAAFSRARRRAVAPLFQEITPVAPDEVLTGRASAAKPRTLREAQADAAVLLPELVSHGMGAARPGSGAVGLSRARAFAAADARRSPGPAAACTSRSTTSTSSRALGVERVREPLPASRDHRPRPARAASTPCSRDTASIAPRRSLASRRARPTATRSAGRRIASPAWSAGCRRSRRHLRAGRRRRRSRRRP